MLLLEVRTYDGEVLMQAPVTTVAGLDEALTAMRGIAKDWKKAGGTLDSCRLLNLSPAGAFDEEDGEPDNVVAFVDEDLRDPLVIVDSRLELASQMLARGA